MKQIFLLLTAMVMFMTGMAQNAGKITPPAASKTAFEKAFRAAEKATWGKEKDDCEVAFVLEGKQMAVVYNNNNGVLKEAEVDIAMTQLPSPVTAYIKEHYLKAIIKEAAKILLPDGTVTYEAEVNKRDLIFYAGGKFVRDVKEED